MASNGSPILVARIAVVLIVTSMAIGLPWGPAQAYTGGPVLIEVLGFDPVQRRVWIRESLPGETGGFGLVTFFDVDSSAPNERRRADWNRPDAPEDDPEQQARLAALRSQLDLLKAGVATALPKRLSVAAVDSVETPLGNRARYRLKVLYEIGLELEAVSYSPEFVIKDIYSLPDNSAHIYVATFRSNPYDGLLAETQVPLLIRRGEGPHVVAITWQPREQR